MFKRLLTDPKEHDINDFVYLVHGIENLTDISHTNIKSEIEKIINPNFFYRSSLIAELSENSSFEKIGYCGGRISQYGTLGDIGFIVNPASDSLIKIAWNCSLGSPKDSKDLEDFVNEYSGRIRYPLILLTQTIGYENSSYNEIIVKGDNSSKISGIFYKPKNLEIERSLEILKNIVYDILKCEIPIIELSLKSKNPDEINLYELYGENLYLNNLDSIFLNFLSNYGMIEAHSEFYKNNFFKNNSSSMLKFSF